MIIKMSKGESKKAYAQFIYCCHYALNYRNNQNVT